MSATHPTATRATQLAEHIGLLKVKKELTRHSDEFARCRQALLWARIGKSYRFKTENGSASLADLSGGRSQLLVYHFVSGPDYRAGCPPCLMIAGGFDGFATHLANRDVVLVTMSHGPLAKLLEYRGRIGWGFPWASSVRGDFNYDFNVSITEDQQRADSANYNYVRGSHVMDTSGLPEPVQQFTSICGADAPTYVRNRPGMNAFMLESGVVCHTYSTYAHGLGGLWDTYQWLDRTPLGRNKTCIWWRRHDEYA